MCRWAAGVGEEGEGRERSGTIFGNQVAESSSSLWRCVGWRGPGKAQRSTSKNRKPGLKISVTRKKEETLEEREAGQAFSSSSSSPLLPSLSSPAFLLGRNRRKEEESRDRQTCTDRRTEDGMQFPRTEPLAKEIGFFLSVYSTAS